MGVHLLENIITKEKRGDWEMPPRCGDTLTFSITFKTNELRNHEKSARSPPSPQNGNQRSAEAPPEPPRDPTMTSRGAQRHPEASKWHPETSRCPPHHLLAAPGPKSFNLLFIKGLLNVQLFPGFLLGSRGFQVLRFLGFQVPRFQKVSRFPGP